MIKETIEKNKVRVIFFILEASDKEYEKLQKYIKLLAEDCIFLANPDSKEIREVITLLHLYYVFNRL